MTDQRQIRDFQIRPSKYITPTLGRRSGVILCLFAFAVFQLYRRYLVFADPFLKIPDGVELALHQNPDVLRLCLIGFCHAAAVSAVWMATATPNRLLRGLIRGTIVFALAMFYCHLNAENLSRNFANLCGTVVLQSVLFFFLEVPDWQVEQVDRSKEKRNGSSIGRRQFGIGDVIITTTSVAVLLAVCIRYTPPIESRLYWGVLMLGWLNFPIVAALLAYGLLRRQLWWGVPLVLLAIVTCVLGIFGLTYAESIQTSVSAPQLRQYLIHYSAIIAGYFVTLFVVVLTGRIEGSVTQPRQELANP